MASLPSEPRLRTYIAAVISAGVAAAAPVLVFGHGFDDPVLLVLLLVAGMLGERSMTACFGDSHVSVSALVIMIAAVNGGARDAVALAVMLGIAVNLGNRLPAYKTAFNVATYVLSSLALVAVLQASRHVTGAYQIATLSTAALADLAVNALLVAGAIALSTRRALFGILRNNYGWLAPQYVMFGTLAYVALLAYSELGAASVVVIALPLAAVHVMGMFAARGIGATTPGTSAARHGVRHARAA